MHGGYSPQHLVAKINSLMKCGPPPNVHATCAIKIQLPPRPPTLGACGD